MILENHWRWEVRKWWRQMVCCGDHWRRSWQKKIIVCVLNTCTSRNCCSCTLICLVHPLSPICQFPPLLFMTVSFSPVRLQSLHLLCYCLLLCLLGCVCVCVSGWVLLHLWGQCFGNILSFLGHFSCGDVVQVPTEGGCFGVQHIFSK